LDGHVLASDTWTKIPTDALADRTAEHNLHIDLQDMAPELPCTARKVIAARRVA
jgi:hypothetical protein